MKFPFLASFLIFIVALRIAIGRSRRKDKNADKEFWQRENDANNVRRKPLDDVEYIHIPLDSLPTDILKDDETVSDCVRQLEELSEEKIINLTGMTNTDLKLKYGVANLPFLTECDDRFTTLVQTLQKWADYLWEKGLEEPAVTIMEYEVKIRADIGSAYRKLAAYYKRHDESAKIDNLIAVAETLNTATQKSILRSLKGED